MRNVEDELLVRRVAVSDDAGAISELYDRYGGVIYGLGVRYLGDRSLAEDLVQDVFLSVWRNAASFDPSRAAFATWLYRITRNRATDLVRRRKARVQMVGGETLLDAGEDPVREMVRSFDLASALAGLSSIHRDLLLMAYMEGLTQREIAHRTDTPLGTVKSRTTSALRALRETMLPEQERAGNE